MLNDPPRRYSSTLRHARHPPTRRRRLPKMTEDERYRTSTQFRYWSYTPAALLDSRTNTNSHAALQVREAVQRARQALSLSTSTPEEEDGQGNSDMPETEVDCLTVEEELMFVTYSARQLLGLGDHIQLPTEVKVWKLSLEN